MKIAAKGIILALVSTAAAFAQTPKQVGSWSLYPATGNQSVLLQTTFHEQNSDAAVNPVQAKLDVICKKGRLSGIAIETTTEIGKNSISFSGAVPTTRVASFSDGQISENWAVLDGGHTVSPYSELFQSKESRTWIQRISGTQQITVQFDQLRPTFETQGLSEALTAASCSY